MSTEMSPARRDAILTCFILASIVMFIGCVLGVVHASIARNHLSQPGEKERRVALAEEVSVLSWCKLRGLPPPIGHQCGLVDEKGRVLCVVNHQLRPNRPDAYQETTYLWCLPDQTCLSTLTPPVPE